MMQGPAKWKKYRVLSVIVVIVITLGLFVLQRLYYLGAFHQPENVFSGNCSTITGIIGPEDIQFDYKRGLAYISAFDRRAANAGKSTRGSIYLIDLNKTDPEPVELPTQMLSEFQPHGISLFRVDSLTNHLLVINHRKHNEHTIERFANHENRGFRHLETISGDALISPNNIAAIDEDSFYFTNDGRSRKKFVRSWDTFLYRSTGSVGFYDGETFTIAEKNLHFPNGIAADTSDNRLYLTETTSGLLKVYQIEQEAGNLTFLYEQKIGSGADNINIDKNGNLWVARHPNLPALNRHMTESVNASPSQVLSLHPTRDSFIVNLIFSDDGRQISGASSAIPYKNRLLIGAAFEDKMLLCERK